jgi:integrase
MVRIAGLEPARLAALPPQSSVSANSTICADNHISSEFLTFPLRNNHQIPSVLTRVLTRRKNQPKKRFQRVANGLYRFKRTGTYYSVFKVGGKTRWKSLATDDLANARQLLSEEIKNASRIDWRQAKTVTLRKLIEMYKSNPMGLATSTMEIRNQLLNVFERTWGYGLGMKANAVKPMMLKSWLAARRQDQSLKASGVNNYIRLLHGLFQIALETGAIAESPAKSVKLLTEENPERLTPTWEQAQAIITTTKKKENKDVLAAMLYFGLGQAELKNLSGEHFDFGKGQITIRRQKTQRVFLVPMYPQARPLLERFKKEGRIVTGKPLFERVTPREAISYACRRLTFPQFSPRSFRRAFIIRALENGIDPRCVAAWQGHRDAMLVLRVYGHLIHPKHSQEMAQRMK